MTTWQMRKQNLIYAYSQKNTYLITLGAMLIILFAQAAFIDYSFLVGNLGKTLAFIDVSLGILLALLFGINIALLVIKLTMSGNVKKREGATTTFGGIIGVLVTGCPTCSITLASYIGLAGLIGLLPFQGLELKVLGILVILYSIYSLLGNLTSCTVKTTSHS